MLFFSKNFNRSVVLASFAVALLTACGQSATDTASSGVAQKAAQTAQTVQTAQTAQPTRNDLLDSLAVTYPNGQLPAANAAQAAKELAQNPAALHLTAQPPPQTSPSTGAPIQSQAAPADYKAVTRIQNTTLTGAYFFTIYDTERTAALANNPNWKLEGAAFWASLAPGAELNPVHRFRNVNNGSYLYTIYETEKAEIAANYTNTFAYEGIAWYAQQTAGAGWSPLYRFRNLLNGTYLFSAFETEKDAIVANYPAVFKLEGVAYYVRQDAPAACTAAATASTGYSLVFKGCSADNAATYYDKTECVRDNASGLIWQGQTPAGTGLRANDQYKSNYDSTTELQKYFGIVNNVITFVAPTQAEVDANTNSVGYKNAVNASNLCGSSAWRLPTRDELFGIVNTTKIPMLDITWFPNTPPTSNYWASTGTAGYAACAWSVSFSSSGYTGCVYRTSGLVRLVR